MRTLKLVIAYDGTDFAGWQRQAATRTVQASIEDALAPIHGGHVAITGAGRTDAGVHAAAQVASVSLGSTISTGDLRRALNATLPDDVRILRIEEMQADFNARIDARQKTYRYVLHCGHVMLPQWRRFAWHVPQQLDIDSMQASAQMLIGQHDFAAFQAAGSAVRTTVREMMESRVISSGPISLAPTMPCSAAVLARHGPIASSDAEESLTLMTYEVTGTGFLRHMVRNIVGTLVDIGRARRPVEDMQAVLASRNRARASATAPAHGLTLWSVDY